MSDRRLSRLLAGSEERFRAHLLRQALNQPIVVESPPCSPQHSSDDDSNSPRSDISPITHEQVDDQHSKSPDIQKLLDDLGFFTLLTGVRLTYQVSRLVPYPSDHIYGKHRIRRFDVYGSCFTFGFKTCFDVIEEEVKLIELHIQVDEQIREMTNDFVVSVCKSLNIQMFFSHFSSFCEIVWNRMFVLLKLLKKFPNNVILPRGEYGSICKFFSRNLSECDDRNEGVELMFVWELKLGADGRIEQYQDILPKYSSECIL